MYDKTDRKLQFVTALEGSEPNEKRFEKLLGYVVDKQTFKKIDEIYLDPVWNRVNWSVVDERLQEAIAKPAPEYVEQKMDSL